MLCLRAEYRQHEESTMHIQSFQPNVGRALKAPEQQPPQPEETPKETFTPQDEPFLGGWGPTLGAAAVGAGLGVFAGLGTGVLPTLAGVAAGTGLGVAAAAGSARVGLDEISGMAGAAGLVGGAIAGGYLGYAVSHPAAAIALGAAGGLGFAFFKAMSEWK